jgi:hypothetical protein
MQKDVADFAGKFARRAQPRITVFPKKSKRNDWGKMFPRKNIQIGINPNSDCMGKLGGLKKTFFANSMAAGFFSVPALLRWFLQHKTTQCIDVVKIIPRSGGGLKLKRFGPGTRGPGIGIFLLPVFLFEDGISLKQQWQTFISINPAQRCKHLIQSDRDRQQHYSARLHRAE